MVIYGRSLGTGLAATLARDVNPELLVTDGAGHNDIHRFPAYLDGLAARLNQLAGE